MSQRPDWSDVNPHIRRVWIVREGVWADRVPVEPRKYAALIDELAELRAEVNRLTATQGLPAELGALLRDPTVTVPRDHEVRLADGRTLFDHLQEWRNAPSDTASAHITVEMPKPWWFLHVETCPRYGKVSVDATSCTCDEATRAAINAAAKDIDIQMPGVVGVSPLAAVRDQGGHIQLAAHEACDANGWNTPEHYEAFIAGWWAYRAWNDAPKKAAE